jgi:penicillin-binding protein 2
VNVDARQRVFVLRVLVISLVLTLLGRLWFLQVLSGPQYTQAARANQVRELVDPAPRGQIVDDQGRPLATNRYEYVVTVNNETLSQQPHGGAAVLQRLAPVVGLTVAQLKQKIRLCGPKVPQPCYTGSPYQPVPVKQFDPSDQAGLQRALVVEERSELFPGVDVGEQAVRVYPDDALAAHEIGYIRPISAQQLTEAASKGYQATEQVGQAGLEEQYDKLLRGTPSIRQVSVNASGNVTGTLSTTQPVAGETVVTNLDAALQKDVEIDLEVAIKSAQTKGASTGAKFLATTASAVVVDVTNGAVLALASAPSYDPNQFIGTLTDADYAKLSDPSASNPLISRAFSASFPPGSTFKGASATAILANGLAAPGTVEPCPTQYTVPGTTTKFNNFEGESFGAMDITTALEVSCDTFFYPFAYDEWQHDGGLRAKPAAQLPVAKEVFAKNALSFGYGSATGLDLPGESSGIIYDRAALVKYWQATKADDCKGAKTYAVSDPARAALDQYDCTDGFREQAGDAVDFAIGQGAAVDVTPLQQAMAYAAIGNGGTVYEPQLAKAFVKPDGTVASVVKPKVKAKLDAAQIAALSTVRQGLSLVVSGPKGTAAGVGFDKSLKVGGKTGTADVAEVGSPLNGQTDSWFTSLQPIDNPKYAVVVLVEHGGQGADAAAPVAANIYKDIYGLDGHKAVWPNGVRPTALPKLSAAGVITPPQAHPTPVTPQAPLQPGTPDPIAVENAQKEIAAAAAKAAAAKAAGAT